MGYCILTLLGMLAVWQTVNADCLDLPGIPLGTESLKESKGQVCGYTALITGTNGENDVEQLGLADWFKANFSSSLFKSVALPLGSETKCPEYADAKDLTSWPGPSKVYLRREFELPAESMDMMQDIEATYIVDDRIITVYVNEQVVTLGPRVSNGPGCGYFTAKNKFTIPASFLVAGKNVLAVEAADYGGTAYLDLGLAFRACSNTVASAELHPCSALAASGGASRGCRARCDEKDHCRNRRTEDCSAPYAPDVSGSCLCTAAESLMCSGPVDPLAAEGVCYESEWVTSQVSRVAFCAPEFEISCPVPVLAVNVPAQIFGMSSMGAVVKVSTPTGDFTDKVEFPGTALEFPLGDAVVIDQVTVTPSTGGMVNIIQPEPNQELNFSAQQACSGRSGQFVNFGATTAAAPFVQWNPSAFSPNTVPFVLGAHGASSLPVESKSYIFFKTLSTYKLLADETADTCFLRLSFAETYFTASQKRVFSVKVRGAEEARFDNLDVFAKVGKNKVLEIVLPAVQPAADRAIEVDFIPGSANFPMIASIVLCC